MIGVLVSSGCTNNTIIKKECLADNECFEEALISCEKVDYSRCLGSFGCEKASILGEKDGKCLIRNWSEDSQGNVINYDVECLVPKGYKIKRETLQDEGYASRIC